MRIVIESDDGPEIEIHVHANGTASVRAASVPVGTARWEKTDNTIHISLPGGVLSRADGPDGLSFSFEK